MRNVVICLRLVAVAVCLAAPASLARDLTFEERVAAQEAIERVYYSHQIGATRPFEEAVPRAVLEAKVRKYLKQSVALERFWHTPVSAEMLHREMERQAQGTRMPERLRELYSALGNDVFLIQECLARPTLVDRLVQNFFAFDEALHAEERQEVEDLLAGLETGEIDPAAERPSRVVTLLVRSDFDGGDRMPEGIPDPGPNAGVDRASVTEASAEVPEGLDELANVRELSLRGTSGSDAAAASRGRVSSPDGILQTTRTRIREIDSTVPDPAPRLNVVRLSSAAFDRFRAQFGIDGEEIGPPEKEIERYLVRALLDETSDQLVVATFHVPKRPWAEWWVGVQDELDESEAAPVAIEAGSPPEVPFCPGADGGTNCGGDPPYDSQNGGVRGDISMRCAPDDTWDSETLGDVPNARLNHTAVWTGSVMVVWGGDDRNGVPLNTGWRYDPATDLWTSTAILGAPSRRARHTAAWTGSRMVVWGGSAYYDHLNTGGRYDPVTDTWTPTATVGAPSARTGHTAVWTGTRMMVWGGEDRLETLHSGGNYDPATDQWSSTSTLGAPSGRKDHTAVWTGSCVVVWGGSRGNGYLGTGGRYDPIADTWTPTNLTGAPSARWRHSAVWTGREMVVWGGRVVNDETFRYEFTDTGGRYDPATDTWTATSTVEAASPRELHTAVWTGSLMVIWGGYNYNYDDTGGRYDPATNTWTATSTVGAPPIRYSTTAVWTGRTMVVWGGNGLYGGTESGGRYDPTTNTWTPTSITAAPSKRYRPTAVWTGNVIVLWGGDGAEGFLLDTGGRYDPATDTWTATSTVGAPSGRYSHTAVWTGSRMVIWGGQQDDSPSSLDTGGRYDPITDTWTTTSTTGVPIGRWGHTAIWTGSRMVIWGGYRNYEYFNTGGRYDPITDTWTPISTAGAPSGREEHTAVWTGSRMLIWGGLRYYDPLNTGGRYDPVTNTWTATPSIGAPSARFLHTAVWTGSVMVVWGGLASHNYLNTGGRYDPVTNTWTATTTAGAPTGRAWHTAVWIGNRMVVWGGGTVWDSFGSGARYDPTTDGWVATSNVGAPARRRYHIGVSVGNRMMVWGGSSSEDGVSYNSGGRYVVGGNAPPVANAGPDQAIECTGGLQATAILDGSGSTDPDSTPGTHDGIASFEWSESGRALASGQQASVSFSPGAHDVVLTVTDECGASGTDGTIITVRDTTPPSLECPADLTSECQASRQAEVAVPAASSTDVCYGTASISNDRTAGGCDASGSYPLGPTTVTFTARDGSDNTSACTMTVNVVDSTPPTLEAPAATVWECAASGQACGEMRATASDACGSVTCANDRTAGGCDASGCFPLGETLITFTATDDASHSTARAAAVFVTDTTPPSITCPPSLTVECQSAGQAYFALSPATASDACYGGAAITNSRTPAGADASDTYPLGVTVVTFTATDGSGNQASCQTTITVLDTIPPALTAVASPNVLWPPNHKMSTVNATVVATDACDPAPSVVLLSVTSSEQDDAKGDGDGHTRDDIQDAAMGTADFQVLLRAERDGNGPGRTYTIVYQAADHSGNPSTATVHVAVPHDMSQGVEPINLIVESRQDTILLWGSVDGARHYDVIRGDLASLRIDGSNIDLGQVACIARETTATTTVGYEDTAIPAPGQVFFYAVQYNDGREDSSYGSESAGRARVVRPGNGDCS